MALLFFNNVIFLSISRLDKLISDIYGTGMEQGLVRSCGAWSCPEFNFSAILEKKQFIRLAFSVSFTAKLLSSHFNGPIQARSVVIFPSTHKNIWSRNLSKLSEKYCVLYFLFEIVVWIQTKNKALILSKLGANTTLFWSWILEHALSSVFRLIAQLSFISKERGVFLCAVQTGRAHSQHWFLFPCGCAILLTMKGDGRSSCFVVASSTFSSN